MGLCRNNQFCDTGLQLGGSQLKSNSSLYMLVITGESSEIWTWGLVKRGLINLVSLGDDRSNCLYIIRKCMYNYIYVYIYIYIYIIIYVIMVYASNETIWRLESGMHALPTGLVPRLSCV